MPQGSDPRTDLIMALLQERLRNPGPKRTPQPLINLEDLMSMPNALNPPFPQPPPDVRTLEMRPEDVPTLDDFHSLIQVLNGTAR